MKILSEFHTAGVKVVLYHNSMALADLFSLLPNEKLRIKYKEELSHFASIKRQTEYLATRIGMHEIFGANASISYSGLGSPILNIGGNQNLKFSVSHSNGFIAIAYSEKPVGIDIEKISTRTLNVSKVFLHDSEIELLNNYPNPFKTTMSTLMWCCKESAYKLCGGTCQNIGNVRINSISDDHDHAICSIKDLPSKAKAKFFILKEENLVMSVAVFLEN